MKIKVFGFALLLGLATVLGACTEETTPTTDVTPAPGEPVDGGASTAEPTTTP